MEGRRRITLLDQMSDVDGGRQSLAGLTLDDVLRLQKAPPQAPPLPPPTAASGQPVTRLLRNQTLIDIIQDDHSNKKEKTPWKAFKDRLLNKRSSTTWTSSVPTPISDISIPNKNKGPRASSNKSSRKGSLWYVTPGNNSGRQLSPNMNHNDSPSAGDSSNSATTRQFSRIASTRINSNRSDSTRFGDSFDADASYVPDLLQIPRHNATHQVPTSDPMTRERRIASRGVDPDAADYNDQPDSPEDRTLSAREAVLAQEAAEAAAAASAAEAEAAASADAGGGGGLKMSLMDLLEEEGLSYMMDDDDDDEDYEDEDEDEDNIVEEKEETSVEYNCCVCMVRHKGAAFIPCGHAFCRLCSRELYATRGNCPLCNNFIAEILDIF